MVESQKEMKMRQVRIKLTTLGLLDLRATNCAIAALRDYAHKQYNAEPSTCCSARAEESSTPRVSTPRELKPRRSTIPSHRAVQARVGLYRYLPRCHYLPLLVLSPCPATHDLWTWWRTSGVLVVIFPRGAGRAAGRGSHCLRLPTCAIDWEGSRGQRDMASVFSAWKKWWALRALS